MSAAVRAEIAAAMNAVEGIHATPYFRQTTRPGQAFVRLARWRRDTSGFGFMVTWEIFVILPQDLAGAETYLDEKLPELTEAAEAVLILTTVTPSRLALDSGHVPVVVIEGNRAT
jgi:hypothetical protein